MAMEYRSYSSIRDTVQPGDIMAFGGKGEFSDIIKWATRSVVSHVGIVLQSTVGGIELAMNQLIESTSLNGFSGVTINRLSDRVDQYDGEIWWLPLGKKTRAKLDLTAFLKWCLMQDRKPYDMPQAVKSALDQLDKVPILGHATHNVEDFARFFCSELAAAALEAGGAVPELNASEVTPVDLCSFNIYDDLYVQVKGARKEIRTYNRFDPAGWGT
ncbi:hypothetical protein HNQ59_002435 [Chitinivorax tropicus]|uniref:Uncharacterized protein n=1 Tax=Chitinivorax tropicus TaxID=714531 RepID=A0A840MQ08_9PROT|nr:hypothetical protein [Chitinivorax tropicus]MBB5019137.1 hypothetical protein [Chitinivorax tropicus]